MKRNVWLSLVVYAGLLLMPIANAGASSAPIASSAASPAGRVPAGLRAPADTAFTLVHGGVSSFTIAAPKVYWYSDPGCSPASAQAVSASLAETIQRVAAYGGIGRLLFAHPINQICPGLEEVGSNIVSDGNFLYWMSNVQNGLVKLSVDANFGDTPTLLSNAVSGNSEIVLTQGALFVLTEPHGSDSILWRIDLSSGAGTLLTDTGAGGDNFQADENYLYWLQGAILERWDLRFGGFNSLAGDVTGYYPLSYAVYFARGNAITMYFSPSDSYFPIYTSSDSSAVVFDLTSDGSNLFWFENHTLTHNYVLNRAGLDGSAPSPLHSHVTDMPVGGLLEDGQSLFWREDGNLLRLPTDAAALPMINLFAISLEVTQGLQTLTQGVDLIQNRDTYVRFYVSSSAAAVPDVTAFLYRVDDGGNIIAGPLVPVNPAGQLLTMQPVPDRNNLNDSFLFELPYSWTELGSTPLILRAVLNPNQYPLEPNYADNTTDSPPLLFKASPRLVVYFVSWGYTLNNQTFYPRPDQDIIQTFSWLRRAYPVASAPGYLGDPTPGFRPTLWTVMDPGLGARVNMTAPECTDNLCASAYTNIRMSAMRTENGVPNNFFMYGMISDAAGIFPRGQACCGANVSSGPAGSNTWGWDTDGSYADWYAGHEIGHTLGRGHPASSAASCGNSADDSNYPYPGGQIGPTDGLLEGFDVGNGNLGLPLAVYPSADWHDLMSYCARQWISDYTYNGMYDFMIAHPQNAPQTAAMQAPSLNGNWLAVYGNIISGTNTASLTRLRHLSSVASIPPLAAGPYSIELFNASNVLLQSYPFTPQPPADDEPNWLALSQVVTYVANTAQLRIVRLAGNVTLTSMAISPHAPTVSNVALAGAPDPVTGGVTLHWTTGDQDGNQLTFDIFYSRDHGASVQPLKLDVTGTSTSIDTSQLGGSGSALLRVVATDGVNTAQADSAPFTMANKPPQPTTYNPAGGTHRHYGQLINFSGDALDAQDGSVSGSGLVWSDQNGPLGTGPLLSISDLPVGTDVITLRATDSANLSASTSITVVVDDDLSLPGPMISVGPAQFAWAFAASDSPAQSGILKIHNAGGGTLHWTANTDAPWLQLSATSGWAPASLTLTASAAGYTNATAHSGHVLINIEGGNPAQQVVIPVDMAVGGSASDPPLWAVRIYLPAFRH